MKSISLTAGQRLSLVEVLGLQTGRLSELMPYQRLISLLRIDEEEAKELDLKTTSLPSGGFSASWRQDAEPKSFSLEDTDAHSLLGLLESWPAWRPSDLSWLLPVTSKLRQDVV